MRSRLSIALVLVALLLGVHSAARTQQNPYRLKQTDQKQICLECHADFSDTLKKRFVHTPVRSGECSGCHNPHVSSHGKLLANDPRRACVTCHDGVVPANPKSTHQVVAEGECQKCHDPHASDYGGNLVARGNDLCVGCHAELGASIQKARFKHRPVEQGCVTCHAPHGSAAADHLLERPVPDLCVGCHKPDQPTFAARHMQYPVGKAACTSCHDPHGSDTSAMLFTDVHEPVANRACQQCHESPDSPTPFATKRPGYELCRGCHNEMVTATMGKRRLHWPVADQRGCANCHSPHASKQPKLLSADTTRLCGTCHVDTVRRLTAVTVQHAPVQSGECVTCHSPHGSNGTYLVDQASVIELCTTCHDYRQHSAHPVGAEAIDPRNKNLQVDCLSCHGGHGTPYKWMLIAETNVELCTQCHKQFGR